MSVGCPLGKLYLRHESWVQSPAVLHFSFVSAHWVLGEIGERTLRVRESLESSINLLAQMRWILLLRNVDFGQGLRQQFRPLVMSAI